MPKLIFPENNLKKFTKNLLEWFSTHHRPLPWKGERDPYRIWLSEIILQQTRVEQGLPYYLKFTEKYPDVQSLAAAPDDEVFKLWEGLGYYSRARNLLATARFITSELQGRFPDTYDGIRALKGVGDYTAAAIASFAYQLPHAVLDGNVYRVLSRYWDIDTPTDTPEAKKMFAALAQSLLDTARPADYNQAIMDFGATVCTPAQPACATCPLAPDCQALHHRRVAQRPVKSKTLEKKSRCLLYAVFNTADGETFVRQRNTRDIWMNLYEFPGIEPEALPADLTETRELIERGLFGGAPPSGLQYIRLSQPYKQVLTHRVVTAAFCEIHISAATQEAVFQEFPLKNCLRCERIILKKIYAFPRVIDRYLSEKNVSLSLF